MDQSAQNCSSAFIQLPLNTIVWAAGISIRRWFLLYFLLSTQNLLDELIRFSWRRFMQNDYEHIYVEFFDKAKHIFFTALNEFQYSTKRFNRNLEEYRFNRLKEQYIHSLKQQLEETAKNFIEFHQHHKQLRELDQRMQQIIKEYLHQFSLRSPFY